MGINNHTLNLEPLHLFAKKMFYLSDTTFLDAFKLEHQNAYWSVALSERDVLLYSIETAFCNVC